MRRLKWCWQRLLFRSYWAIYGRRLFTEIEGKLKWYFGSHLRRVELNDADNWYNSGEKQITAIIDLAPKDALRELTKFDHQYFFHKPAFIRCNVGINIGWC